MAEIQGVVSIVTYSNPDNGWSVLKVGVAGMKGLVTVTGTFPFVAEGTTLHMTGNWKDHPTYGHQFVAQSWTEVLPTTPIGITKFLAGNRIKGIGPTTAQAIIKRFGSKTLEILDKDPDRLLEVSNIGKKRLQEIKESWAESRYIAKLMTFLLSYGVGQAYVIKIFEKYGEAAQQVVSKNPYRLIRDIDGIGFKLADRIAMNMGIPKDDPNRCRSALLYSLTQLSEQGHVYAEFDQLVQETDRLLEIDPQESATENLLKEMIRTENRIVVDGDAIYLNTFYNAERDSAESLYTLVEHGDSDPILLGEGFFSAQKTKYDEIQKDAILTAVESHVMVLTGGPGTGKTTTVKGMIAGFKSKNLDVLLAAPTGRAAKRMHEATNLPAKTIHRLLEYKGELGFTRNEDNKLEGDVLIVDECSMIDIILFSHLIKAIPLTMKLVLVGDIDQLPSVGPGNVLRDIIDSGIVPVVRLTTIFRQSQTSKIVTNAHAINAGHAPDVSNTHDSNFFFIPCEQDTALSDQIVSMIDRISRRYNYDPKEVQVLTPMLKGPAGTHLLNTVLQEAFNPIGNSVKFGDTTFRLRDKVMQIRNNYDKKVFNGDIGYVQTVDEEDRSITVNYGDGLHVTYESDELDEIVLAYAITIHKSQGSEFEKVVMPVTMSHFVMLQRNLIYTGITRAKNLCVLVGDKKALGYAIRNQTVTKRNSRLKERLMGD